MKPQTGKSGLARSTTPEQETVLVTTIGTSPSVLTSTIWALAHHEQLLPHRIKEYVAQCPLGRLGTAAEVAEMAAFLVSEENTFMTGSKVVLDGGL